ncbi:hypothetical protein AB0878_48750 [Amycolatopsis sp. NPDC047767]|uniref:hypothetical protein n=1 Tax=Amycolatopsis sp. NPDC047767 TaxID=3156765 RepID=UPI003453C211
MNGFRPTRSLAWPAVVVVVGVLDFATLLPGWWWATAVVALAGGLLLRGGPAYLAVVLGSVAGWAGALFVSAGAEAGRLADLVGVVATGESGQGWLAVTATAVTALALATTAAWLGGALRRLRRPEPVAS